MKRFFLSCFLVTATFFLFTAQTTEIKSNRPNVILIMVDDMGVEALETYGNTANKTPNINKLARSGILFENCVSQPLCTPSRVKIMTGQYNYRNYGYFGHLASSEKTFGNLFKDEGYATCIAGKWQLNGLAYQNEISDWSDVTRPNQFGFDEYCLWQLAKPRKDGERYADPLIQQNGEMLPRNKNSYGPDVFLGFITDFIDRKKDQPFFVYYPMVLVHDPFVPTPDSDEWKDSSQRMKADTSYFKDMVQYTDKIVGRIVTKLNELNITDETLLIFTADNGTHPSIYSPTTNGVIRGGKGNTTTAGTHVPLIASWGKQSRKSLVYEGLVEFSDFYATFADLLKVNVKTDGRSFLQVLKGNTNDLTRETALVHYDPKWGANVNKHRNRFVRTLDYKLYQDGEFYHIKTDVLEQYPLQKKSLSADELSVLQKLKKELAKHPTWI
jgi:arylsulfatase A